MMPIWRPHIPREQKAQTAVELAIFGAVLIFVLGLIIRQAMNAGYAQNQTLKAMRQALAESFKTATGSPDTGGHLSTARNTASLLLIEDRLTADPGTYGPIDRVPYIIPATGTFSSQLFQPIAYGEEWNLPVFDMIINGQHFVFSTAGFVEYDLSLVDPGNVDPALWVPTPPAFEIEADCRRDEFDNPLPCRRLYTKIPNHQSSPFWCDDVPVLGTSCAAVGNLDVEKRFDLNRNDGLAADDNEPKALDPLWVPDPMDPTAVVPELDPDSGLPVFLRNQFTWQWWAILGVIEGVGTPGTLTITDTGAEGINTGQNQNTLVDVDRDNLDELILNVTSAKTGLINSGVLERAQVIDYQEGDIDFTRPFEAPGPQPGLQDNITFFSFTQDGTFLVTEEGELLNTIDPNYNMVKRSTQRRKHVDLIQRTIFLSKDTGWFCHHAVQRRPCKKDDDPDECVPNGPLNPFNPGVVPLNPDVEACSITTTDCFTPANIVRTCYEVRYDDLDGDGFIDPPRLYVRSRIANLRGRKWVTTNVHEENNP